MPRLSAVTIVLGVLCLGALGIATELAASALPPAWSPYLWLLQRANTDGGHPIPVVLTLSSWALRREPLGDWIVRELAARYDIPAPRARTC